VTPLRTVPLLLLVACAQPSRDAVEMAAAIRRAPPGAADALAMRPFACALSDRACVTLWAARGAACARAGEGGCARDAFRRATTLMPGDATPHERAEVALRLADAEERGRDRATGEARRAANTAILDALAPLRGTPVAAHYEAGVALNRVQSGDLPAAARCPALRRAGADAARAAKRPNLPPLGPRIAARRAAIATQLANGCAAP
jgi:hypothetical protein